MSSSKFLTCGCCGDYFRIWPTYVDQDQDRGFGICQRCQIDAQKRNEQEWIRLEEQVSEKLNPANRIRFNNMDIELRRGLIMQMIDDGVIQYQIKRNSSKSQIRLV